MLWYLNMHINAFRIYFEVWGRVSHLYPQELDCSCCRRSLRGLDCSGWSLSYTQVMVDSSPPPLSLEYIFCPSCLQWELFSRTQPSEITVSLRPLGLYMWLNPIKASIYTFKNLVGGCEVLPILWLPRTSLMHKVSCLLKLPPPNLDWSASSFGLSMPCMYRGQFMIQRFLYKIYGKNQHITQ